MAVLGYKNNPRPNYMEVLPWALGGGRRSWEKPKPDMAEREGRQAIKAQIKDTRDGRAGALGNIWQWEIYGSNH